MWQKIKIAMMVLGMLVLLIAVLQNTAPTQTNFLFFEFTLPQAGLLFLAAGIGFLIGVIMTGRILRRRSKTTRPKAMWPKKGG